MSRKSAEMNSGNMNSNDSSLRAMDEAGSLYRDLRQAEQKAMAALSAAERGILAAQMNASSSDATDEMVEAFTRWLPEGRREIARARAVLEAATFENDLMRRAILQSSDSSQAKGTESDSCSLAVPV